MRYAQLFDGTRLSFPDDTPDEVINRVAREETLKRNAPPVQAPIAPSTERTTGEAVKDIGAALVSGTGKMLAFPGQAVALVPGLRGLGSAIASPGEALAEYGESLKSQGLKVREALRSQAISEAEKDGILSEFGTAIKETLKDPALISTFLTEQVPNFLPPMLIGRLAAKIGVSTVQGLTGEAAEQAVAQAQRRGVTAAVGTGAAMQSADISSEAYKQAYEAAIAQGKPPEQAESEANNAARIAAGGAFGISLATQKLPGARAIEQRLIGAPGGVSRVVGGLGEATAESLEEAGGALFQNIGIRTVDPNQSLTQGVGAAAGLGLLGGGFFGTLLSKKATPEPLPGQLPGETIEQSILRLVAERESLKAPPVPESIIPDVDVIKLAGSLDEKGNPIGYALLTQYEERLKQLPESPERDQALQVASSVKERLNIESIQRQQNAYQNIITYKDMKDLGLNESDPLYEALVGKNLGAPDDATKVIEALNRELEQDISSQRRELVGVMLEQVQGFLDQVPGSGFYAPRTDQRADGAGASVSDQLGAGTPGEPQTPSDASLDASTGLPGKRDEGEGAQPSSLGASKKSLRPALTNLKSDIEAQLKDWRSKVYKPNEQAVFLKGDGPSNREMLKIGQINESRRQSAIENLTQDLNAIRRIQDQIKTEAGLNEFLMRVDGVYQRANQIVEEGTTDFANPGDLFEYLLLNEDLKIFPPRRGAYSSNSVSKAIRAIVEQRKAAADQIRAAEEERRASAKVEGQTQQDVDEESADYLMMLFGAEPEDKKLSLADVQKIPESKFREIEQRAKKPSKPAQPKAEEPPSTDKLRIDQINKELETLMKRLLSKYGLKDVSVQIVKDMAAKGEFSGRLIKLADDTDNPLVDLRHEAIHALKELGFFTPAQWETLKNKAAQEWVQTYLKDAPYTDKVSRYEAYKQMFEAEGKNPQEVEEALIEEAIADAFSYFNKTRAPSGLMASINFRLKNLFKALKQFLTDSGLSAEDIFGRIEEGKLQPAVPSEKPNQWKADATEKEKAEKYEAENGIKPYVSEGQIQVPLEAAGAKLSIKKPYAGRELEGYVKKKRDGTVEKVPPKFNDPMTGLPLNADGTVTVYLPTTNEAAREIARTKKLKGSNPTANRIYLTNESSGPAVMNSPGNIDSPMDGANVMLRLDPRLLNLDQEFENGRKDFFIPIAEGQAFAQKAAMTKMFTMNLPRDKAISKDTTLADLERRIEKSINDYLMLSTSQQKERLDAAKDILKKEHNVGSLLTVNGKLEKTNTGGYGLNNYNGKDVVSMGLGLASAQKINEKNLSTCPNSSMCEGLCLGETSGQNQLYGGDGQFRSGPRLAQYLKTEALILHPEEFAILLHSEIDRFHKAAVAEDYQPSIRMNVTSDFRPQTFKALFAAFPGVEFYDYTKLPSNTIAPNHHLTYSSTGASQVVNGEVIINPGSNWSKMIGRLRDGNNVAMAFTSKTTMPDFVLDEKSGERFQVWNGDNYDARFLDPKPGQPENLLNKGMIIGLTNKDRTTPPSQAAKQYNGFFMDYERSRDGPVLIIRDQSKLKAEQPVAQPVQLVRPKAKFSLRGPKVATWFSGARTLEAALGDINTVMAVEYDKRINEFANSAFGTAFVARDVADVDVQEIKDADPVLFHASPVCKNFSAAKTFQGADDADRKSAEAVSKVIREVVPPIVTVENVPKYASTALFQNIVKALDEKGYTWDVVIHDAADYGAAQTRNRMLLRAVKDGELPPLPEKVGPSDWYKQIEDLLPDAPASTLPPVERRRLNEMIDRGQLDPKKPIITMGGSGFKGTWAAANDGGPSPTLKAANEKARVLLPDGEVKVVTPRMMARLMGLPDTYAVPSSPTLAKTVLGNGIHGDVTRSLIAPLLAQGSKFSLRAYHGSPTRGITKFSTDKIGTGEGAQAYGWGLYFASMRDVAEFYRINLANRDPNNQNRLNAHANAQRLAKLAGDPSYAADDVRFVLETNPDHPQKELLTDTLRFLESGDYAKPLEAQGQLYEVDIPEESEMLLWDKPLSEQPKIVRNAIEQFQRPDDDIDAKGSDLYLSLQQSLGSAKAASKTLADAGIKGIKYYGDSSYNYVIFSDEDVTIVKTYYSLRSQTAWTDKRIDSLLSSYAYTQSDREGDSKAYAARITPRDFINATTDTEAEQVISEETRPLSTEELAKEDQPIYLEIRKEDDGDYQIVNHEGRHRMMALANAGYDRGVPVVLVNRPYGAVQNAEPVEEAYLRRQSFGTRAGRKGINVQLMVPISWKYRAELKDQFGGEADVRFSLRSPDTKAFKQWFGDSKVVDANGNPLVVYHGTNADIAVFDSTKQDPRDAGFWFANEPIYANQYAAGRRGGNVMPVYLSIKNPKIYYDRSVPLTPKLIQELKKQGYDGVIRDFSSGPEAWRYADNQKEYAAFESNQIKSAIGNIGTFDPANPDIRYSLRTPKQNIRSQIPQNILTRVDATIAFREDKTFARRMMDAISPRGFSWFREQAINRYEYLAKIDRKYVNRMGGVRLLADQSAEAAALFSDLGAGITASAFGVHDRVGGIPVYRNGVVKVSNENNTIKGPLAVFAPLGKYGDPEVYRLYEFWATVKRGARLNAQGKLTPFTPADMAHAQALERQFPEFVTIQREWIKYNDGLVKFMQDTGVITPQAAQEFKQHGDYFPMYKYFEGDEVTGPKVFSSIANVAPPKKYKGDDQPLGDFFENVVRNTQAAIQAGIKNIAAQRATQVAVAVNEVTPLKFKPKKLTPEVYRVLENGMERYYAANDMMMISALKSLNIPDLPLIGVFAGPANLLRNLITKTPDFMLANMLRDSLSAWVTSGKNITPITSTLINFSKAIAEKSPELNALRNAGILGGYDYAQGVEATAQTFAKDLRKISNSRTTMEKITSPVTSLWGALEKASSASDAATRMEVYKKTLAETGNEAEALFQALEIMNFNRKGRSPVIRALTAAVPFLNARIQGLDVLYRSGIRPLFAGDATAQERARAKTFFLRGATIMALSAMYWMMTHDDDEYKVQEQETRDNYWLLPSMGVKIPIPFEIGVIFKVIPERILEYSFGDDTGKDFVNAMSRQLLNTFSFNPIPQTVVPIVEAATNYSFFTTRPILGQGMEGIAPEFQATPTTSKTATAITDAYNSVIELMPDAVAKKLKASPVILEHLIQGYTGTMGMYAMQTMDYIISANSDVPNASKRFEQMPVIRRFAVDPQARGTVTAFYDMKNAVDSVTRTANYLERTMNFEDQAEFIRDNIKTLAVKDYVQSLEKTMKEFREQKVVIRSSTMSADAKRSYIDIIEKMELQLTANIRTLKKQME